MSTWVQNKLDDYLHWLKVAYRTEELSDTEWARIVTPFLGLHNDNLEIYIRRKGENQLELSDDGTTLWELEAIGLNLQRSGKRQQQFQRVLNKWGVQLSGKELVMQAPANQFAQAKHDFLQCLQELNEFHHLTRNNVQAMFKDDVYDYFDNLDDKMVITEDISLAGGNLKHTFDLMLSSKKEERIVKAFNTLHQNNLLTFLYAWEDARAHRDTRKSFSGLIAVNDEKRKPNAELLVEARENEVKVLLWSERNDPEVKKGMQLAA